MKKLLVCSFCVLCLCSSAYSQESKPTPTPSSGVGVGNGSGSGVGSGIDDPAPAKSDAKMEPLRILSKPRPPYTDEARKNGDEGVVRLRVTFLNSGEIGSVAPISGLPNGLTEQAIAAAKQIKFTPQKRNEVAVTTSKVLEYSFSIYYKDNDEELQSSAEITEKPAAEHPAGDAFKNLSGKVLLLLALTKGGNVQVIQSDSELPQAFKDKAAEAAAKIKFKPAIHKNGKVVSQTKEIEYEFKTQGN